MSLLYIYTQSIHLESESLMTFRTKKEHCLWKLYKKEKDVCSRCSQGEPFGGGCCVLIETNLVYKKFI